MTLKTNYHRELTSEELSEVEDAYDKNSNFLDAIKKADALRLVPANKGITFRKVMQSTFDTVVKHLLTQKEKSCTKAEERWKNRDNPKFKHILSLYRGENGLKNVIGCLVSDEEYETYLSEINGKSYYDDGSGLRVQELSQTYPKLKVFECTNFNYLAMLHTLSYIHDNEPVEEWEESLKKEAEFLGLTFPA